MRRDPMPDHRRNCRNCRTVKMNPMFPMEPYHALPRLHEASKADGPAACCAELNRIPSI